MNTEIQIRCKSCFGWVQGATNDRHVECRCGKQYMVSAMAVDVQG